MEGVYIVAVKISFKLIPEVPINGSLDYIQWQIQVNRWQYIPQSYNSVKVKFAMKG